MDSESTAKGPQQTVSFLRSAESLANIFRGGLQSRSRSLEQLSPHRRVRRSITALNQLDVKLMRPLMRCSRDAVLAESSGSRIEDILNLVEIGE